MQRAAGVRQPEGISCSVDQGRAGSQILPVCNGPGLIPTVSTARLPQGLMLHATIPFRPNSH